MRSRYTASILGFLVTVTMLALVGCLSPCFAEDFYPEDPLNALTDIPPSPAKGMLGDNLTNPCLLTVPASPLQLFDAVEHALCSNPATRNAWANVKVQAAQVGSAESAFLPTLNVSAQDIHDHARTGFPDASNLDTDLRTHYRNDTLTLSWMLYDFGARSAALENAKQLLAAAQATHDATLQKVFATTAKDYYAAAAAQASVVSTRETEMTAKQSLQAATARVGGGVAPISDQLQAQTAYAQAVFNRVKAEGEQRNAIGTLELDMGLALDSSLRVIDVTHVAENKASLRQPVNDLLEQAKTLHPSLIAARAQLDAAIAKEAQIEAQGNPTISLTARASRSTQPESLGLGMSNIGAHTQDRYLGVQLDIPLFEGFSRTYQVRNAVAQIEVQRSNLADAEQQVLLGVWTSYQALQTGEENLHSTAELLASAQAAYEAGQKRYQMGVGNILELLSVQSALASAQQQRIQAITDWNTARLQLAASIGRLGIEAVR